MHIACHCSNDDVATLLVQAGANTNSTSAKQLKPLDIAIVTNNQHLISLLRPHRSQAAPEKEREIPTQKSAETVDLDKYRIDPSSLSVDELRDQASGLWQVPSNHESSGARQIPVVLLKLNREQLDSTENLDTLFKLSQHPNLFKAHGLFTSGNQSFLVSQTHPNFISLKSALVEWPKLFSEKFVFRMLTGICYALIQLHSVGLSANLSLETAFIDQSANSRLQSI